MESFFSWAGAAALLLTILLFIIGNAVRFVMWLKCRKMKVCHNRQCINKTACGKYREILTENEQKELLDMAENAKKEKP